MAWTDSEKKKFGDNLQLVAELMGKEVTPAATVLFVRCMESEVNFDTALRAIGMHLKDTDKGGSFFPKPADLLRLVKGSKQDMAQVAWAKVDTAVRRYGTQQSVVFDDGAIHRVIADMGGWPVFGEKTEEEWPFVANEFRQRYHGVIMRGELDRYPPSLPGTHELQNSNYGPEWYASRGMKPPAPLLIGDPAKAKMVLLGGSTEPLVRVERLEEITARLVLPEPAQNAA